MSTPNHVFNIKDNIILLNYVKIILQIWSGECVDMSDMLSQG